jgi:hypothetical protein
MNRCVAGGIAWSLLATRYEDGIVFHAGVCSTPDDNLHDLAVMDAARFMITEWPSTVIGLLGHSPCGPVGLKPSCRWREASVVRREVCASHGPRRGR